MKLMRSILLACVAATALACGDGDRAGRDATTDPDATGTAAGEIDDAAVPEPPAMAVTVDDLPWVGALRPGETREQALRRMIDAFVSRGVPAMAFPNCDRVGATAPLPQLWVDAGLELGNHTAAHLDLNSAPLAQWLRDVESCHEMIRQITGEDTIWFRYPFLHQGPTAERQQAALAVLAEIGSPVAHVTIDNSDWILAVAYGEAVVAGDSARAAAVADAFVDHILRATEHYQQVAQRKLGRDVPHVLLLHANLMVADHVGTLLDRLAERGFRFVTVAAAHRDPAYALPDEYTGGEGLSWLYRMAPASPDDKAWDDAEAARLRAGYR